MENDAPGSLRFRLFGFPVAINWSVVFLGALVLGSRLPLLAVVLFFLAAVLSVVIHELGHAFAARSFGARVQSVFVYMMGGLTSWVPGSRTVTRTNAFVISAAGSGTEIVLGMAVFALMKAGVLGNTATSLMSTPFDQAFWYAGYAEQYVAYVAGAYVWFSVVWGLFNWLPIGGFDGSHMLHDVMIQRNPQRGADIARVVSIVVSAIVFVYLYSRGYHAFALLIAIIALPNLFNR